MTNELIDVLEHLNDAYEVLEGMDSDIDIEQWMVEVDNIYHAIEHRIKSGEEE